MSIGDKIITSFMIIIIACAILTLISYLLYELWNIGEVYFSMVFFMCSMVGASCLVLVGVIFLNAGRVLEE